MRLLFGPTSGIASVASNSESATIPICCTNASSPFFVAFSASKSGSINCCVPAVIVIGVVS